VIATRTTVGTTAVKIISAAINEPRIILLRADGNDLYIGGSTVTSANGFKVDNNTSITINIPQGEELYAITASGTHAAVVLTWPVETA
jgi:hypothetical protein